MRDAFGFPDTSEALDDPPGLLAAGGDLSPARLIHAYKKGLFPWYSDGQPILWWTPNPRCVLDPVEFHFSRSLRKSAKKNLTFRCNTQFAEVMRACAETGDRKNGTWIDSDMLAAYQELNRMGVAHSIEVIFEGALVGGLYGLHIGGMFFGESMFSTYPDASKLALAALCVWSIASGIVLIDCQVENPHLLSLGAKLISRLDFEGVLGQNVARGIVLDPRQLPACTRDLV